MKTVNIPFREQFRTAMLSGQKVCTTRTRQYGKAGDTFGAFGAKFKIVVLVPTIALWVGNFLYREEGFEQPWEFHKLWRLMHPRLADNVLVYVHVFRREEA